MEEKIITTRRGVYGHLNITLPLAEKTLLLSRVKRCGMSKSEFLKKALVLGASILEQEHNHDGGEFAPQPART